MSESSKRKNAIINGILIGILAILVVVLVLQEFVISLMRVEGDSMMPTLTTKEIVFTLHTKKVTRGDIVVFRHNEKLIVKRVIAIGGDSVAVDADGIVRLNGEVLSEDYILDGRHNIGEIPVEYTLEEDEIFVLGDNRCNSNDSHDYGPIKMDSVIGKILK